MPLMPDRAMPPIVFSTTCKGRAFHVESTLLQNIEDNPSHSKFVLLDYNSQDGLIPWLQSNCMPLIRSGKLVVYSFPSADKFHVAHAKNMAHRLAIQEGADFLVTLDADNFTGSSFEAFILEKFSREKNIFLCPKVVGLGSGAVRIAPRGVAGRLVVRSQDFIKAGGYDEKYATWHGEDVDLVARLKRMGYAARFIDPIYLDAIRHGAGLRFKEYPHAQQYENDEEVQKIYAAKHSIVNFGNFGCGIVYRNFGITPITIKPLATRVFGIGLHKTATTSLYKAFQVLGFTSFHWDTGDKARDIWDEMTTHGHSWMLERYYALCDLPIPLLYQQLDRAYPGSKFILTVRDEQKWVKSVERLWDPRYNPSRWEWDVWPFSNRIHRELYGQTNFDAGVFLARYRRHNAEVREYFKDRPQDLAVMDIDGLNELGWRPLCVLLNKPIPKVPYPRERVT